MKKTTKLLSLLLAVLFSISTFTLASSAASLAKVTDLAVYNIDDDEINLKWSKVAGADGYQVYVYNDTAKKWTKLPSTSRTTYEVDDLVSAKSYKFRVRAYDKKTGGTVYSAYTTITAATEPDEVDNVKVSAKTKTSVTLSWTPVKRATGYQVYIYSTTKGKFVRKTAVTGTTAKITGRKEGTSYKFKVRAYFKQADGTSRYGEWSDVISVTTSGTAANKPAAGAYIGNAKAESIALQHAGLQRSQVREFECKLDKENGVLVYDVDFSYGVYEYEYEIDAYSGGILNVNKSRDD
ncbi:MAG: fibronectin type III domain-containing protein [Clostridia bacterium]|nr:fibronectin type III domain-containing protein [Clostridia bacterium]